MKFESDIKADAPVKPLRICLAASGGGHVRQILDLESFWSEHDSFFVTEDTALGRSIAETHETYFLPHVALGQVKAGHPFKMVGGATKSFHRSLQILRKTKPDIILTTGAGSMAFVVLWAKLFGAKVIMIDSFARFEGPSKFARYLGPLAQLRIAQAQGVADNWKNSLVFDPFRLIEGERPSKEPLLFATVGATLTFPRLIDIILDTAGPGKISETVILQAGKNGMDGRTATIEWAESYTFAEMKAFLQRADFVVCHGGTGSLITALQAGCKVIAIPRRKELGEHYDDHQAEITDNFRRRGLIEIADNADEFAAAMKRLRDKPPVTATTDYTELADFLRGWTAQNS